MKIEWTFWTKWSNLPNGALSKQHISSSTFAIVSLVDIWSFLAASEINAACAVVNVQRKKRCRFAAKSNSLRFNVHAFIRRNVITYSCFFVLLHSKRDSTATWGMPLQPRFRSFDYPILCCNWRFPLYENHLILLYISLIISSADCT